MPELTPNDDPRENVGNADSMMDCRLGQLRVVRMDDGTEIESRSMTKAERQMGMNFGEGKAH